MWRRQEGSSFTTLTLMTVLMTLAGTGTSGTTGTGSGTSPSTCRTATLSDSTKLNRFVQNRRRSLIVLLPMFLI